MKKIVICLASLLCSVTFAHAFNPVGSYTYKEKGNKGKMVVTQSGEVPNVLIYKITTVTSSGSDCDIDGIEYDRISAASSIESMVASKPDEGSMPAKFEVKFMSKGAEIVISEIGSNCGVGAGFGGTWIKNRK